MKKTLLLASLLGLSAGVTSSSLLAAAQQYSLDPEHTTVAFLIEHVGYAKTLGYFSDVSGTFSYDDETGQLTDVVITVKTDSVQSDHKARDKHVRSKDFLNTKKFPEMSFTADNIAVQGDGTADIAGELQLLGTSQPLSLTATLNKADKYPFGHKQFTLGVSARGQLQRSDYGMDYGVANALVGDVVELIIETEANRQQ
ncbi:YceI family protein [Granulosicoccus sp. 3-233]|uniref:YceI family protein n=1 Tax=Granulosicoccus sp. 3-233 TaxID=3417969 RepID=UPI003D332CFD